MLNSNGSIFTYTNTSYDSNLGDIDSVLRVPYLRRTLISYDARTLLPFSSMKISLIIIAPILAIWVP